MATLSIENIPDALYDKLKQRAAANNHTVSWEAILMLQLGLSQPRLDVKAWLAETARLRETWGMKPTTLDEIDAAKREGRP